MQRMFWLLVAALAVLGVIQVAGWSPTLAVLLGLGALVGLQAVRPDL